LKKIKAVLDESKLIEMLHTVESVYTKLGPEFMLSLNIPMASGGSEAIAESFYAIMDTQRRHQDLGAKNKTRLIGYFLILVTIQTIWLKVLLRNIWKATIHLCFATQGQSGTI
jgi:hypothetical protein